MTKRRRRWRRIRRTIYVLMLVMVLGLSGVVAYIYTNAEIPRPEDIRTNQVSVIYYADGSHELARLGEENRTSVSLDDVPKHVQNAVLAAENRSFWSDPGFSFTGIIRAVWNNLTGDGGTQGGSTITQQYVKKAFLTDERTFSRKFKELVIAIKLEREYSKEEILELYLNTIYFGRGAYGIEAAAQTYFGKPVGELTAQEAAVLAVSIRSPSGYDPQNHPQAAQERWEGVLDAMVEEGWLSASERKESKYPAVLPAGPGPLNQVDGPEGHIVAKVKQELAEIGIDESRIYRDGLRITTTIDKASQQLAVQNVQETLATQPPNLRGSLVSVDPQTGGVVAYYGGPQGTGYDYAQAYRQPGSSFKPFTLAAALEQGIGVYTEWDGSSPQTFPDRPEPVRNSEGKECADCTLKEAITQSLNTTFYGLAYEIGPSKVAKIAHEAGIGPTDPNTEQPTLQKEGSTGGGIGIGEYEVTTLDQASAFATFAANGVHRAPHFVQKVTDAEGNVVYEAEDKGQQTIPTEIAEDVSFALSDVAEHSDVPLEDDRPVAAKTGTVQLDDENNKDAWMVGYTPQTSTAVWVGTEGSEAILNADGEPIYGSDVPGTIWQGYMNGVLANAPVLPLPDEPNVDASYEYGNGSDEEESDTTQPPSAPPTTSPPPTTTPPTTSPPPPPPTTTPPPPPTTEQPPALPTFPAPPPTTQPVPPPPDTPPPTSDPGLFP